MKSAANNRAKFDKSYVSKLLKGLLANFLCYDIKKKGKKTQSTGNDKGRRGQSKVSELKADSSLCCVDRTCRASTNPFFFTLN